MSGAESRATTITVGPSHACQSKQTAAHGLRTLLNRCRVEWHLGKVFYEARHQITPTTPWHHLGSRTPGVSLVRGGVDHR